MINQTKTETNVQAKKHNVGYIVSISILCAFLLLFIVLYSISASASQNMSTSLEGIYEKNFYDLVDNINNTETKLAKTINATESNMQAKLLKEVSYNAKMASTNFNNLPYSMNDMSESVAFINQLGGYTETLANTLEKGKTLSSRDIDTLEKVYDSVLKMKNTLSDMNTSMLKGYNIINMSKSYSGENNQFSLSLAKIKEVDVDYPTMIYDGPFSDSVVNKEIKGLNGNAVSKETAQKNIFKCFTSLDEASVEYTGETLGRFETYNFSVKDQNGKDYLYIQMTKNGGHLLTATSFADDKGETITISNAKEIAINFAKRAGIENPVSVWSATIHGNAYINIAPKQNGVILYPDLVKIKIDLNQGDVLGYEATNYYTNHQLRTLATPVITSAKASGYVPKKFNIKFSRLALIPLEYNQEILTYEVCANLGADEYYFYYDVQNGNEVNILKVMKTDNGELLM